MSYRIAFESPGYLLLLLLVPLLWWYGFGALASLGPVRRIFALGLRTLLLAGLVCALAEVQMVRVSEKLTVIYLLDQSLSIPSDIRRAMVDYTNAAVRRHREADDRAGVIVFGREAAVEVPPFDYNIRVGPTIESPLDPEHTDLASAMKLAMASFPEDAARRIVVVSDGNENQGSAAEQVQALAAAGVGVDVVPIRYGRRGEVIVERAVLPSDIRRGQPFDLKVVITNTKEPTPGDSGEVRGQLRVHRELAGVVVPLQTANVVLPPGKKVFTLRQQIDTPGFFTYSVEFVPDRPEDDTMRQNNRASAYTHIQGKGHVLLLENATYRGEYDRLVRSLGDYNIEVVRRNTQATLFTSLAELQQFDAVVLGNVPRDAFDDNQIQMLVRNTQQMGAGLVMLGGPESYGAGGWANTELEKAMPVDFTIKNARVVPRGALAMIMHASEIPEGNHWQKEIAKAALNVLGPRDYCGVVQLGGANTMQWLWQPGMAVVGEHRESMLGRISRMTPGDMPSFDPGLRLALSGLLNVPDAGVRHMIVISDGDPAPPSASVVQQFVTNKITVTTVAVGAHGQPERGRMKDLADATGGKYYEPTSGKALPRIFQTEARRVTQPSIYTNPAGIGAQVVYNHEILSGISDPPPPVTGYVLTTRKQNPLVEVILLANAPTSPEANRSLLAAWTYGLGRSVALTTDATSRWTASWTRWENYTKLIGQTIRWSMRPVNEEGKFHIATELRDGRMQVVVTAMDAKDEFVNLLPMSGAAVAPNLENIDLKMEQVAPGRYVGSLPAQNAGSYLLTLSPGPGKAPLRTGVNVPYSDEFRALAPNESLLRQLPAAAAEGVEPGLFIDAPEGLVPLEPLLEANSFRHDLPKAYSSQGVWPAVLLLACCLLWNDVFVRRVQVSFAWVPALVRRYLGRKQAEAAPVTLERLRSRKAEVSDRIEQLRAAVRFEPAPRTIPTEPEVVLTDQPAAAPPKPTAPPPSAEEKETYTERLLKAKEKARKKRE